MKNADMPAMPTIDWDFKEGHSVTITGDLGLTKRETFAMHAMQGILSGNTLSQLADFANENGLNEVDGLLKTMSYAAADLMLSEGEEDDTKPNS